jgi:DNA-binding response OmpR family regulator
VLVVDDDKNARNALAEILSEEGYEVQTAYDGVSGMAEVDRFHPDLVITDVGMPNVDGIGLARAVRVQSAAPRLIFVSATRPRLPEGAVLLPKPIDVSRLLILVAALLTPSWHVP